MNVLMALGFVMSYFGFQGGSAFFNTCSMSTNPFNSKTFKRLAQDMPLLLERSFLTVRKGPSRIYKPNLQVTNFF